MARPMRRALVGVVTVAAACTAPAAAQAVTVAVRTSIRRLGRGRRAWTARTQCSLVPESPVVAAPFDGCPRWRVRGARGLGSVQLSVLRRPPARARRRHGSPAREPGRRCRDHAFEERIAGPARRPHRRHHPGCPALIENATGPFISVWKPPAADGTNPPPTGNVNAFVLGLNADVERDNDGDMLGTRPRTPTTTTTEPPTPPTTVRPPPARARWTRTAMAG